MAQGTLARTGTGAAPAAPVEAFGEKPAGTTAAIAAQIAASESGDPILLVGRHAEMDGGEVGGIGVDYALGRLLGGKALQAGSGEGPIVFPTSAFASLSRFSLRAPGDFSTLRLHKEQALEAGEVAGTDVRAEDIAVAGVSEGRSLRQILGISEAGLKDQTAGYNGGSLMAAEADEVRKSAFELAIGRENVIRLMERMQSADGPAAEHYAQDFSLLRAIMGDPADIRPQG